MSAIEAVLQTSFFNEFKDIKYECINESSNHVYVVTADGLKFAVRINGKQYDFMGLSAGEEKLAIKQAALLGATPDLLSPDDADGYIITRFVESSGKFYDPTYFRSAEGIASMVSLIKKIHTIRSSRVCSPFYMFERYANGIREMNVETPDGYDDMLRLADNIYARYIKNERYALRYSHNDFFCFNLLDNKSGLYIIDWELSGMSSMFFDLSTISFAGNFTDELDNSLLSAYFGNVEDEYLILLRDMKTMNMIRDIGWHLLQAGIRRDNPDWVNGLRRVAERAIHCVKAGHMHFRCDCKEI